MTLYIKKIKFNEPFLGIIRDNKKKKVIQNVTKKEKILLFI